MPISKYFAGHGEEVMKAMLAKYGASKGEQVFYATANKRKQTPSEEHMRRMAKALAGARKYGG